MKGMTENEMVGWHHRLNGHEFEWAPGVGDGQGSLVCCSPWGRKELDRTEWMNDNKLESGQQRRICTKSDDSKSAMSFYFHCSYATYLRAKYFRGWFTKSQKVCWQYVAGPNLGTILGSRWKIQRKTEKTCTWWEANDDTQNFSIKGWRVNIFSFKATQTLVTN